MADDPNFGIENSQFNLITRGNLVIPIGDPTVAPLQEKGSLLFYDMDKEFYISDGEMWKKILLVDTSGDDIDILKDLLSLQLDESSTVPGGAPSDGQGKLWVRDNAPNELIFTDDAGTDHVVVGTGSADTLTEILANGNTTGGTDIELSSGDSVVSTGQIPIISSQVAPDALQLEATNGGIVLQYSGSDDVIFGSGTTQMVNVGSVSNPRLEIKAGNLEISNESYGLNMIIGTVTQTTSNTTPVGINARAGKVTMFGVIPASTTVSFLIGNAYVSVNSIIFVNVNNSLTAGFAPIVANAIYTDPGGIEVRITNTDINSTISPPVVDFFVVNPV